MLTIPNSASPLFPGHLTPEYPNLLLQYELVSRLAVQLSSGLTFSDPV